MAVTLIRDAALKCDKPANYRAVGPHVTAIVTPVEGEVLHHNVVRNRCSVYIISIQPDTPQRAASSGAFDSVQEEELQHVPERSAVFSTVYCRYFDRFLPSENGTEKSALKNGENGENGNTSTPAKAQHVL